MTTGFIIGGGTATMLNLKSNLMRANGKKVQFTCSEEAPVTVKTIDGTTKTVSYIPELDLSSFGVGNRTIALGENNNAKQGIFNNSALTVSTDGWVSGFVETKATGYYYPITYPTTKEEIFPITFEFKANSLPTALQTLVITGDQCIWAVNINPTGTLCMSLGVGNDWNIALDVTSTEVVELNVPYLVTLDYDGATYTMKVRNMAQEGATDVTFVTVESTTLIAGTSATIWGHNVNSSATYFDGSILGQSIKVGTVIDNSDFLKQSMLGVVTITADGITNITNNYQAEAINPLEEVIVHTESSAKDIDYDETDKLNLAPFNFSKVNWSDNQTVNADTVSTYTKDGVFFANSIATVTYTDSGIATGITTNIIPVKAGDSIKSTVAGKIFFYY